MKLIKASSEHFVFELASKEKQLVVQVLKLYPLAPLAHSRTANASNRPESQQLLEEALAGQRRENKNLVEAFLTSDSAFRDGETNTLFTVQSSQVEWLLQVLNDIHVGCWQLLGGAEDRLKMWAGVTEKTLPYFLALNIAEHVLNELVEASDSGGHSPKTTA